ncbi:hypothetical protein AgCh_018235 [Apium graveolens]
MLKADLNRWVQKLLAKLSRTVKTKDGVGAPRKRGRPRITVTEDVLEKRIKAIGECPPSSRDGVGPPRHNGRPKIIVTGEVLERRRLSRQRVNSRRKKIEEPPRKRARSKVILAEDVMDPQSLSIHRPGPCTTKRDLTNATEATGEAEEQALGCQRNMVPFPGSTSGEGTSRGEDPSRKRGRSGGIITEDVLDPRSISRPSPESHGTKTAGIIAEEVAPAGKKRHAIFAQPGYGPPNLQGYSICCGKGKVQLPLLHETPPELNELIRFGGTGFNVFFSKSREAVDHWVNFTRKTGEVDPTIVSILEEILECENTLVNIFKQVRERFAGVQPEQVRLRLFERRTSDGRFQNLPTANDYEFAGLVVDNDFVSSRDVVAEHRTTGLQHISDLHPSFMSLQYPLLFPFGEDGYRINIKHRNADNSEREKDTVSMREYYAFRAHYRIGEGHTLLLDGRLFLQFIVDAWCSVERSRLLWVHRHQSIIRSDLYNNIIDSLRRGDVDATEVGRRVILPSSFTGGYRYMQQNFQDSLAVCKEYGHPDLFITFTCNPKWVEIQEAVQSSGSHDASVRPDIVARVFKLKLDAMLNDFTKKHVLGRVLAVVYTVEFQKRGLSHAHIVLWLAAADKLLTPEDIDNVISAEIPDKIADPEGYKSVSQLMMHEPCGEANPKCPCMFNGRCTKLYPKPFSDNTIIDVDGYALYRRRDTKVTVECKNIQLDNRHVVPYHRGLLVKYQGHINVEWCNRSLSIKYLVKYIGKGPDTATTRLEKGPQQPPTQNAGSSTLKSSDSDEVNNYLSCRYVSAAEACWRLFEFPIHHREPFVQRLYFHLENEQEVRFRDNETLPEVVRRVDPDGTMFIQWMLNNRYDELGQDLTFIKYPIKFRWDAASK